MTTAPKYDPPKETAWDHTHTLARAGIGSIPAVGNAAAEFFSWLIVPPIERRRKDWEGEVAEGLRQLEAQKGIILDELANNEGFVDSVLQATQAAIRTGDQDKRRALLNAVLNSALPYAPDSSKRQLFIYWLDRLTVWHLRIFRLFADPQAWYRAEGKQMPNWPISVSLENVLWNAYPELRNSRLLYDKIMKDLQDEGLTIRGSVHVKPLGFRGAFDPQATELGKEFFVFITSPEFTGAS